MCCQNCCSSVRLWRHLHVHSRSYPITARNRNIRMKRPSLTLRVYNSVVAGLNGQLIWLSWRHLWWYGARRDAVVWIYLTSLGVKMTQSQFDYLLGDIFTISGILGRAGICSDPTEQGILTITAHWTCRCCLLGISRAIRYMNADRVGLMKFRWEKPIMRPGALSCLLPVNASCLFWVNAHWPPHDVQWEVQPVGLKWKGLIDICRPNCCLSMNAKQLINRLALGHFGIELGSEFLWTLGPCKRDHVRVANNLWFVINRILSFYIHTDENRGST